MASTAGVPISAFAFPTFTVDEANTVVLASCREAHLPGKKWQSVGEKIEFLSLSDLLLLTKTFPARGINCVHMGWGNAEELQNYHATFLYT